MTVEEILTNYNKLGTEIIESIYTDNYLSIGGTGSTEQLADLAEVSADCRVLDVGSGVGGPSLHLAAKYHCRVTGLDLVEPNVLEANDRAKSRGLSDRANFRTGDALNLPFENESFDIVWGQDAWCHMPDKSKLIDEVTRVLVPGGRVAFTDWVETGPLESSKRAELLSAMAAPNVATLPQYCSLLEARNCTVLVQEDISDIFTSQYREIMAALSKMKEAFSERYSPKIFQIVAARNQCILNGFEGGALGGARIVAQKRAQTQT